MIPRIGLIPREIPLKIFLDHPRIQKSQGWVYKWLMVLWCSPSCACAHFYPPQKHEPETPVAIGIFSNEDGDTEEDAQLK